MPRSYAHFALAGPGYMGDFIITELLRLKNQTVVASVTVLTRTAKDHKKWTELGAKVVTVDYSDPASLHSALRGMDVLISTLSASAVAVEVPLAEAAKTSGVKLFVPSEFGLPKIDLGGGKARTLKRLGEVGLPYALFYTGPFPDVFFAPWMGIDLKSGKVTIGGSGEKPVSFTGCADIARYVAHVLTSLAPSKVENTKFRMEGERVTFNALYAEYERRTKKKLQITYRSTQELEDALEKNPYDFPSLLSLTIERGDGVTGTLEEVNVDYPGWRPAKVWDVVGV